MGVLFLVCIGSIIPIIWSVYNLYVVLKVGRQDNSTELEASALMGGPTPDVESSTNSGAGNTVGKIQARISAGAVSYLKAQYSSCGSLVIAMAALIFILTIASTTAKVAIATSFSFLVGAITSMVSGYVGMMVAVFANGRVTLAALRGIGPAFLQAFRAGAAMGHCLCGLGLLVLALLLGFYGEFIFTETDSYRGLAECIAGFGLGGSFVAMFGRVGGGIYTKAADVGADLVGKVVHGLEEDDPKNPATIADNVGDNVGDVAGMSSDLFGSLAESTCASLVLATSASSLDSDFTAVCFPLALSTAGALICILASFLATHFYPVKANTDVEPALKLQLISTTVLATIAAFIIAAITLPSTFTVTTCADQHELTVTWFGAAFCVAGGCVVGLLIGLVTEFYTSHSFEPVRECARACKQGAAVNVIYGLALGYKSAIIPVFALAFIAYLALRIADLYGVSLAAVGMLMTLATGLTIDGYGPVTDNAGGIAEMAHLPQVVRDRTDCLDAAGNTTAAIGKGYCIGSAALVSLALYGAFVTRLSASSSSDIVGHVDLLDPLVLAGLLIGANLPLWFSALTMKSVGTAAAEMVTEVERQFKADPSLLDPSSNSMPDYDACIRISTVASLREMVAPAALVMLSPLIAGTLFGVKAVFGLLPGALVCAVQLAVSMSNSGGAWDNTKKYIAAGLDADTDLRKKDDQGRSTPVHDAAVTGDTIGDPFKDTSGPALNILMKLSAILSLVFAPYFLAINSGRGLFNIQ